MIKPGLKTTELIAKIAVDIAATVLLVRGNITPDAWAAMVGTTTSVYVAARTLLKAVSHVYDSTPVDAPAPAPAVAPNPVAATAPTSAV